MKSTLSVQMWHLPLPLCAVTLNVTGLSYCHIVRTFKSPIAISEDVKTMDFGTFTTHKTTGHKNSQEQIFLSTFLLAI